MADPLPPERIAELRAMRKAVADCAQHVDECARPTDSDYAEAMAAYCDHRDIYLAELDRNAEALLAAAEENAKLRAEVERERGLAVHAFIQGADWLRFQTTGFTSFGSERDEAEAAARERYPFEPADYRLELRGLRAEVERLRAQRDALVAAGNCVAAACFETGQFKVVSDRLLQQIRDLRTTIRTIRAARDEKENTDG